MSWHTPERKTEQAFKLYFESVEDIKIAELNVFTRFCNQNIREPALMIYCPKASRFGDGENVGNWVCEVQIQIRSHYEAESDAEKHDEYVGLVTDWLMVEDGSRGEAVSANLNEVMVDSDFTAILWTFSGRTNSVDEHSLVTEISGELLMAPS